MGLPDIEKLEEVYSELLRVVSREIYRIKEAGGMAANDAKLAELADKVLRNALLYQQGKSPKNELSEMSEDDLLKLVE